MSKTIQINCKDNVTAQALAHNVDYWEGVQLAFANSNNLTLTVNESFSLFDELAAKAKEFEAEVV